MPPITRSKHNAAMLVAIVAWVVWWFIIPPARPRSPIYVPGNRTVNEDVRWLTAKWKAEGLFQPSLAAPCMDALFVGLMVSLSCAWTPRSAVLGGALYGMGAHQLLRWAHECAHRSGWCDVQHMPSDTVHAGVLGLVINAGVGFDYIHWRTDHQEHHEHTSSDDDPQFGGLLRNGAQPIYSFDVDSIIPGQEVSWLPILSVVGKLNLWVQGMERAWIARSIWRTGMLVLHWAVPMWICWRQMPRKPLAWLQWMLVSILIQGLIEPQFLLNHLLEGRNLDLRPNQFAAQLVHTVNYDCIHPVEEWLHVSLAYQIEHHLCPKMPTEHLHRVAPDLRLVAKAHGLPYRSIRIESLVWRHTQVLSAASAQLGWLWHWGGVLLHLIVWAVVAWLWWRCTLHSRWLANKPRMHLPSHVSTIKKV